MPFGQSIQRSLRRLADRLGPPQFTLMKIVVDRWKADALGAIARLRVADALAAGPRTAPEVAGALHLNADALYRVLRALARWRAAMRADSRLVLIDVVVPEPGGPYLGYLDLQMLLVSDGGRERTEAEFRALLEANGFALERIVPTATPMSMIVARRVA